ncbi:hypothetical protein V8C44DRAFT_274633 [Trichoderma aethiopicum]
MFTRLADLILYTIVWQLAKGCQLAAVCSTDPLRELPLVDIRVYQLHSRFRLACSSPNSFSGKKLFQEKECVCVGYPRFEDIKSR